MAYSPNIIPLMTSDTAPSGVASGSNVYTTYAAWKAFDSDPLHTDYISNGNAPQWLQYQFPSPRVVAQYALRAPDRNNGNGAPTAFTLQASSDGSNWTTLDTQSGLSWTTSEEKTFAVANADWYAYYKLNITACKADGWVVVPSLRLMEPDTLIDGDYTVRQFFESGEFVTPDGITEGEVLVVGGGGGAGGSRGGGGGAGGYQTGTETLSGTMTVTVGAGGVGGIAGATEPHGANGGDSGFGTLTALGGGWGGGAGAGQRDGANGGSGGGGAGTNGVHGDGSQGYAGGNGAGTTNYGAGGGGGSSGAGTNGVASPDHTSAAGGAGTANDITGTSLVYAAGGAGGRNDAVADHPIVHGDPNTGNGGSGTAQNTGALAGGNGGSGIVVIRHLTEPAAPGNLTITSRHKVGFLAALHVTSRHKVRPLLFVRKTITSRHLVGYVYTPPPARLAVRSRHRVDAVQGLARLTLTSRHKVGELVRFTLDSMHLVRDVDPATLSLTSQHAVGFLAALHLTSKHKVGRRSHIVPGSDPPVEVYDNVDAFCQFNGIDLDLVELQLGGTRNTYDTVRHYDGSVLIHDMRCDFYEHRMRIKLKGSSPSNLDTQEQAIQAACLAGGTFAWQSMGPGGVMGTLRTWTVAPSDAPDFERTKVSETLYRSYAPMVLRVWPA